MTEQIILVNEQDHEIGQEEKQTVHEKALLHRAFSVFIFRKNNGQQELLLQQRQHDKYHCGGLWTNSCCGHPRPGETIVEAATRRLQEEMGFVVVLQEVGMFQYRAEFDNGLVENEIDHVLIGFLQDQEIKPNPAEAADYRWIDMPELQAELSDNPENFTPWLEKGLCKIKLDG
jgi:isopentenyl-diphosphate Delta-isomerase